MITEMYHWITGLPAEAAVFLMSMLPVFELRLAVPVGIITLGLPVLKVYVLALAGNLILVVPLLLFFRAFFHRLAAMKVVGVVFRWWFARVEKRADIVKKWGFWGLVCFVAIPLPVTGAWTGAVAATLVEFDIKKAFAAIAAGVAIAGCLVSLLSLVIPEVLRQWSTFI